MYVLSGALLPPFEPKSYILTICHMVQQLEAITGIVKLLQAERERQS